MNSSPMIPTNVDGIGEFQDNNWLQPGDYTQVLNERLHSVVDQVPTNRFMQRAPDAILQYQDWGLNDNMYNVGFHHVPVESGVSPLMRHFEAPEVPVTHTSFSQAIYNSTLVQAQVGPTLVYSSLRAPAINEGY